MKSGKVWGETTALLKTPFIEVHKLSIYPNKTCSLHKHERKWNAFYVSVGVLFIVAHKRDYNLLDETILHPGDFTALPPGEFHRFYTRDEAVECLEIYYPEPLSEDIIRKTIGATDVHN
jgi:mannose-6-phosphate isomerase-like protein (cupin superfamily)